MLSIELFEAKTKTLFSHVLTPKENGLRPTEDSLRHPGWPLGPQNIIPRPSYRMFTDLLAIGPIFGQILSALIVWSNRWLEAETRRQVEWLCSYWVPLSPSLDSTHLIILYNLLHGWGLEFLVLVFDGTTSLLLSLRVITTDRLVHSTVHAVWHFWYYHQYYWLGEIANFSISYMDKCVICVRCKISNH